MKEAWQMTAIHIIYLLNLCKYQKMKIMNIRYSKECTHSYTFSSQPPEIDTADMPNDTQPIYPCLVYKQASFIQDLY